jgi:hypothetical protein
MPTDVVDHDGNPEYLIGIELMAPVLVGVNMYKVKLPVLPEGITARICVLLM